MSFSKSGFANLPKAIENAFVYAGFQCVTLPTLIACGTTMTNRKGCAKSMWISFAMNAVALTLSDRDAPCEGGFLLRGGSYEKDCSLNALMAELRLKEETNAARILFS